MTQRFTTLNFYRAIIGDQIVIRMVAGLLGDAVIGASVEQGLGGGDPNQSATYIAMGNLYFKTMESFENSFGPNAEKIMGDIPNYTNINPVIQISEVMI